MPAPDGVTHFVQLVCDFSIRHIQKMGEKENIAFFV